MRLRRPYCNIYYQTPTSQPAAQVKGECVEPVPELRGAWGAFIGEIASVNEDRRRVAEAVRDTIWTKLSKFSDQVGQRQDNLIGEARKVRGTIDGGKATTPPPPEMTSPASPPLGAPLSVGTVCVCVWRAAARQCPISSLAREGVLAWRGREGARGWDGSVASL